VSWVDAIGAAVRGVPDTREHLLRVAPPTSTCAGAAERFRLMFGPMLANKDNIPGLKSAAERAFVFVLRCHAPDKKHGASLPWQLEPRAWPQPLLSDGACECLPMKKA